MTNRVQEPTTRAERIAAARERLAARYADDPASVAVFGLRMARIDAARKRERQRIDHLVLGEPRPTTDITRRTRKGRKKTITVPMPLDPEIEAAVQRKERWSHKHVGTPETWDAVGKHTDCLVQLERNGTIDKTQKSWADEIANVHRSIESDVAVKIASLEARVDNSGGDRNLAAEGIRRVRLHHAYTIWREALPAPKQMVLDMIVGDAIGYTVAARRYRTHHRKAKAALLAALDLWPLCVARAFDVIDQAVWLAVSNGQRIDLPDGWREPFMRPDARDAVTVGVDVSSGEDITGLAMTDGGRTVVGEVDPEFLDESGHLREWDEIADIIRQRLLAAWADAA